MSTREMPMFPLGMVVFPHQVVALVVFEPRYQQMLADIEHEQVFGTCLIERGSEVGGGDVRTSVATVVQVVGTQSLGNGQTLIAVEGTHCVQVERWLEDRPYPRALIRERCCDDLMIDPLLLRSTESAVRALRALQSEVMVDQCLRPNCEMAEDPWQRAWQLCSMTPMPALDQFKVLSLTDPNERLRLVAEICCERYGDFQRMLASSD